MRIQNTMRVEYEIIFVHHKKNGETKYYVGFTNCEKCYSDVWRERVNDNDPSITLTMFHMEQLDSKPEIDRTKSCDSIVWCEYDETTGKFLVNDATDVTHSDMFITFNDWCMLVDYYYYGGFLIFDLAKFDDVTLGKKILYCEKNEKWRDRTVVIQTDGSVVVPEKIKELYIRSFKEKDIDLENIENMYEEGLIRSK